MKGARGKVKKILAFFAVSCAGVAVAAGAGLFVLAKNLPSVEEIDRRQIGQSTKIYDQSGEVLLYEMGAGGKRTVVSLDQIPAHLKDATIAIEDENFYQGVGVDWRAIARAAVVNLIHGRVIQGGSTITQQLAKNAFLTPEQTILRKVKELILALQLQRRYSKDQILEFYLNEIPYGHTFYGVEAASRAYFGKSVSELNLAQSALLAAIPKAPSYYSPWGRHRVELLERQRFVLKKMNRSGRVSDAELEEALPFELAFQPQGPGLKAPHFVMAVQDYLIKKYGEDLVRGGGLVVRTTLDWKLQELAERVVKEGALRNEELYKGENAALVAEDPRTGKILALVGSRDYFDEAIDGNFDVATQGLRQPGSALKPFVYLTAFREGYPPETAIFDVPTEFVPNHPKCPATPDFNAEHIDPCFHPENFDEQFRGPVSFRRALAQSINIPSVKVLYLAGLEDSIKTLSDFGVTTLTNPGRYGLSLVLGGGEVKLVELVGAYAVLSQEGVRRPQSLVLEVQDTKGKVLETFREQSEEVADKKFVRLINDILSDAEERAGLFAQSLSLTVFPEYDVALKTGTSNDFRDAWAIGYAPTLVAGVWAGNNDNAPMEKRGSSILAAVPIWHEFMKEALASQEKVTFSRPEQTPLSEKPALRGEYVVQNEIHSILYYVDKKNPLGAEPVDPSRDPQFPNWETGVAQWIETHKEALSTSTQIFAQLAHATAPQVKIVTPGNGSFIGGEVVVSAEIRSGSPLRNIRVYFNDGLVYQTTGEFAQNYLFAWSFAPPAALPQNRLEVEIVDMDGLAGKSQVIVYR